MPPTSPQDTPPPAHSQQLEDADEEILSPAARAERDNPRPPPPVAPPTPPLPDHAYDFAQYMPQSNPQYSATPRQSYVPRGHPDSISDPPPVLIVTQPTFVEHMAPNPHIYMQGNIPVHPMDIEDPHDKPPRHHREFLVHFTLCTCIARHNPDDLGCVRRECIGSADLTAGPFKCDVSANGVMALLGAVITWPFVCCIGSTWGVCRMLSGGGCRHG
ncbi:MAG: hypothetical protein M1813_005165 [Trichoglossum hirsutum]|nr:MAG: hypothetical protein M1813_005165 [Trichoglossum hirsutum]